MDFKLTEEQELIRQGAREFAQTYCAPIAAKVDQEGYYPEETVKQLGAHDYLGMVYPESVGGAGADYISYAIMVEEISRVCASTGIIYASHVSLAANPIYQWGSDFLKEKYLKPMCKGEKLGSFALTEPGAGTDVASGSTVAKLEGDHYVLNGTKCFITNAGVADCYTVFANSNPEAGVKGLSCFVVDKDTPGFTIGKYENKMGIRGSHTGELIFKDAKVPKENLVGEEGKGFKYAMITLNGGRISIAAQAVGIAQGALDAAVKFAKERVQFHKPIATKQFISFTIADMQTRLEAARLLTYNAAYVHDHDPKNAAAAASMAKLFAADTASYVCDRAVQIHGGYGYIKDFDVERFYRDQRITGIYEGTSEVQRMIVSGSLLR